jgi:hypothetical protein
LGRDVGQGFGGIGGKETFGQMIDTAQAVKVLAKGMGFMKWSQ